MLQPGKQVVLFGHSGNGKSTLWNYVIKKLKIKHIQSQCTNTMTVEQLMLDAFDQMDGYFAERTWNTKKRGFSVGKKDALGGTAEKEDTIETRRNLSPQLTPQSLAKQLDEKGSIWLIEDFHKVDDSEKKELAQVMKLFNTYTKTKIVAVGAAETGHEVVEADQELRNRISEIEVPLLSDNESKAILARGGQLLNVGFSDDLSCKISNYANGLAAITHQLAYNMCVNNNIRARQGKKVIFDCSFLQKSVDAVTKERAHTHKVLYEQITKRERVRKYDNVVLILKAMCKLQNDKVTQNEILTKICEEESQYPQGNLSKYLKELCSSTYEEVLCVTSGRYYFSDPFFKSYIRMTNNISADTQRQNDFKTSVTV